MKILTQQSRIWFGLIIISFLILIAPLLTVGVPYTHDGVNHLARFANYKLAVKQGQIPPRWAPNLINHYGYPVFNYNYPLANILSLPFSALNIHYQLTYKILVVGCFLFGVVGLIKWLRLIGVKSKFAQALASSSYLLTPFVVNLVYVRGNIGETLAINLIIWLGVMVELVKQNQLPGQSRWARLWPVLVMTSFLLSHNISVMIGLGIMVIYGCFRGLGKKGWLQLSKILGLSLGLSLWFWLPALAEKQFIVLDNVDLSSAFANHFPTLAQLLISPLSFGFSYASSVDTMSFAVGKPALVALFMGLILLMANRKKHSKQIKLLRLTLGLSLALVILQLPLTQKLWQVVPLVNYIQFPWRLGMLVAIFASLLLGLVAARSKRNRWLLLLAVCLQLVSVYKLQAVDRVNKNQIDYDVFVESTTTLNENTPKTFVYQQIADWAPTAKIVKGQGEVVVKSWSGSKRWYDVTVSQKALIIEPTMNFPGWQTTANEQRVEYVDDEQIAGRIAYWLTPGEYQVRSRFTQQTWPRVIGNSVFVLTLFYLGWQLVTAKNTHG